MTAPLTVPPCAACGEPTQGNHLIHRDGFGDGPEVDLCDGCGGKELPSCETLWKMIRERRTPEVSSLEEGAGK